MNRRVVITGIGTLSPLGEGIAALRQAAMTARPATGLAIENFDPTKFITNKKSIKVMCRDIQLAVAASKLAWDDAELKEGVFEHDRAGVSIGAGLFKYDPEELEDCFRVSIGPDGRFDTRLFGQMGMHELFPLWLLKYLPNMPACHMTIAYGLRGPSNTITTAGASSAAAFEEAFRILQRGSADLMLSGGAETRVRGLESDGESSLGQAEGAAMLVLEELTHAQKRGARIYAEVGGAFGSAGPERFYPMAQALGEAGLGPGSLDAVYLSAGARSEEEAEREALRALLDSTRSRPRLIVNKKLTGHLGFASAAHELALAALSIKEGSLIPFMEESPVEKGAILVNHFTPGFTNHSFVLKSKEKNP